MVAPREAAHDAAFLRLNAAQRKLAHAEESRASDRLVTAAQNEVNEASATFTVAQAELKAARARGEQQP